MAVVLVGKDDLVNRALHVEEDAGVGDPAARNFLTKGQFLFTQKQSALDLARRSAHDGADKVALVLSSHYSFTKIAKTCTGL